MSQSARQLIFIIILVTSITVITVVLFYGSGYTINWRTGVIESTSGIAVTTRPKTATITLYPSEATQNSPALFSQLTPGRYSVSVSAPGYHTQVVNVTVAAHAAVQFEPIQLWPESAPLAYTNLALQPPEIPQTTIFNDSETVLHKNRRTGEWLLQQDTSLFIYNPETETTSTLVRLSDQIVSAIWHPNGWYVIYSTPTEIHSIDTRLDYTTHDVVVAQAEMATDLRCNRSGNICYFTTNDQPAKVDLR